MALSPIERKGPGAGPGPGSKKRLSIYPQVGSLPGLPWRVLGSCDHSRASVAWRSVTKGTNSPDFGFVFLWPPPITVERLSRSAAVAGAGAVGVAAPIEPVVDPHLHHLDVAVPLDESVSGKESEPNRSKKSPVV
jgi:hypothetical protein